MGRWRKAAGWLTLASLTLACSKDGPSEPAATGGSASGGGEVPGLFQECMPGQPCKGDTECVTIGDKHRCEHPCETDDDCSAFKIQQPVEKVSTVCGTIGPDLKACREPCTRHDEGAYACVDAHPVSCAALDETSCTICGCPDNLRCEHNVGCGGKRGLDEECLEDGDCNSNNCDFYAHVCRVPVGTACTASNCQRCIAWKNGTFCSRSCGSIFDCDGGACLFQECRPPCTGEFDPSCPGECRLGFHTGGGVPDIFGCLCDPMACKALVPPPDVGDPCDEDSDCGLAGVCLMHNDVEPGFCSRPCGAESPCSKGRSCVDVPCGQSDPDTCGALCLNDCAEAEPRCGQGNCHPLPTIDAQTVEVCDYRKPAAESCQDHGDCQSGVCMEAKCTAP